MVGQPRMSARKEGTCRGGRCGGLAWPETNLSDTDRATLIRHLLKGHYSSPIGVVASNIAEGWSREHGAVGHPFWEKKNLPESMLICKGPLQSPQPRFDLCQIEPQHGRRSKSVGSEIQETVTC